MWATRAAHEFILVQGIPHPEPRSQACEAWGASRRIWGRRQIGRTAAYTPSTTIMFIFAELPRARRAAVYSTELQKVFAWSSEGNSRITTRSGFQLPSSTAVWPPRAR